VPFETLRKAHFIGIAGAGMSAVAKLLRDSGVAVTGSDEGVYPPVSGFLQREGIPYSTSYDAANIPADANLIVIGKNARLVPATNPEVAAAYANKKAIASFPEILNHLAQGKETIVVAGSYGKSTCSALLAHCLEFLKSDPSFFIGAIPLTPNTNARLGKGKYFVLEGDEYPSSNTDARAKFLHYRPRYLLLTPLAHDHVNVYPAIADYLRPFQELVKLPESVVFCLDGPLSKMLQPSLPKGAVTYGLTEGDYYAANIVWSEKTGFDLMHKGSAVTHLETTQLGEHNIQNIVGVSSFLLAHKLATPQQLAGAIASFKGVQRRLDRKSDKTTIPIFEGFGSSREKARSAIAAVKRHFPKRRLVVVFEPHAFSWRNRDALSWYDDAFQGADKVFVYEPAAQGAATHDQLSQGEIVAQVVKSGLEAEAVPTSSNAAKVIGNDLQAGDAVLLLTSGNLGGLIEAIPRMMEQKFPSEA
jgi:UDP-N-acetylmuramate: L-alanyl-gamma-D-glutamyl-meso-diaminopimelate ligase